MYQGEGGLRFARQRICIFFQLLAQFIFTTSETELKAYYQQ